MAAFLSLKEYFQVEVVFKRREYIEECVKGTKPKCQYLMFQMKQLLYGVSEISTLILKLAVPAKVVNTSWCDSVRILRLNSCLIFLHTFQIN